MSVELKIKKVTNGYIVERKSNFVVDTRVFLTTEDLFKYLLLVFEGKTVKFPEGKTVSVSKEE